MYEQLFWNSIVSGLLLALVAVGFSMIFNVAKVFHIAHGAVYAAGGYFFLWMHFILESSFVLSIIAVVLFTIVLSVLIENMVYKPLKIRNAGQAITLISSMGLYILIVNFIALLFGNESKIAGYSILPSIEFLGLIVTQVQLAQFILAILILSLVYLFSRTQYCLQIRAVISNEKVATVLGVNSKRIRLTAIVVGSLMAVAACILKFYDSGIDPHAGMSITLSAVVVVIIVGGFSVTGTISAALMLSFIQTLTEWFFSSQWKEGITFGILILVILWKTEGIVSHKMRIEET